MSSSDRQEQEQVYYSGGFRMVVSSSLVYPKTLFELLRPLHDKHRSVTPTALSATTEMGNTSLFSPISRQSGWQGPGREPWKPKASQYRV